MIVGFVRSEGAGEPDSWKEQPECHNRILDRICFQMVYVFYSSGILLGRQTVYSGNPRQAAPMLSHRTLIEGAYKGRVLGL